MAGARLPFSQFYDIHGDGAVFKASLKRNLVFAQHNLVTDRSFNEFHVVLCRNVMIYFNRKLQDRVHQLLYESLMRLGFLGLGDRETVQFTPFQSHYQTVDAQAKLFRKVA
jgi:chemotaxis protein methyltransferase CheR